MNQGGWVNPFVSRTYEISCAALDSKRRCRPPSSTASTRYPIHATVRLHPRVDGPHVCANQWRERLPARRPQVARGPMTLSQVPCKAIRRLP